MSEARLTALHKMFDALEERVRQEEKRRYLRRAAAEDDDEGWPRLLSRVRLVGLRPSGDGGGR